MLTTTGGLECQNEQPSMEVDTLAENRTEATQRDVSGEATMWCLPVAGIRVRSALNHARFLAHAPMNGIHWTTLP